MPENIFSTPRTHTKTADEMLESMIQKRNNQRQNMSLLSEASKLDASVPDFTATMEAANREVEQNITHNAMMEGAAYKHGSKVIAKAQLGMKQRLIQEGTAYVRGQVLGELIYESYWLDDPVKEATIEQIGDNINSVMGYIEENFDSSKVPANKQNLLLKNVNEAINAVVKEAAERICKECEDTNAAFPEFELTDAENEELDDKLADLGRDEIVDLIKTKVATVVQDEKEKGLERAEMFKSIDDAVTGDTQSGSTTEPIDDEGDETPTEAEEALLMGIESGEITLEGATWDTLKIIFSDNKKKAKAAYKSAAKHLKHKEYDEAAKDYETAKNIFKKMLNDVKSTEESSTSTVCAFLLSGWLEHALIASLGGPAAGVSITRGVCNAISAAFGIMLPYSIITQMSANQDNVKKDKTNASSNSYKVYAIEALTLNIQVCDKMIQECKSKKNGGGKSTLEGAFGAVATGSGYTANERHIAALLENGTNVNVFEDPSWGEFKAYMSMTCKRVRELLITNDIKTNGAEINIAIAKNLIEDLEKKLSDVPEDVTGDVKNFIMSVLNLIYTAVPADEVIISRIKSAEPTIQSDVAGIGWNDLFVNIKTNLASIKNYCNSKINTTDVGGTNAVVHMVGESSLAQKIAQQKSRTLAMNMGSSLFEAMMIGALGSISKEAMESASNISDDDVEDAALIETLLNYTVFETLDTIGLYKFRMADYNKAKQYFMHPTMESEDTIGQGADAITQGTDNSGKKIIRINTAKMKRKTANSMKTKLPTPNTEED